MPWYRTTRRIEVGEEERPQVADVGVSVDRRAAGVHPEPAPSAGSTGSTARVSVLRRRSVIVGFVGVLAARFPDRTIVCGISKGFALTILAHGRYRDRGLAAMHRSPGGVTCEASFPARTGLDGRLASARRLPGTRPYTPAMRRWVCIVALLAGFTGDDYVRWRAPSRPRRRRAIDRSARVAGLGDSRPRGPGGSRSRS